MPSLKEAMQVLFDECTERFEALRNGCDRLINEEFSHINCNHLFHCGAGVGSFSVSPDGYLRLCSSLWHPDCIYKIEGGSIKDGYKRFISEVRDRRCDSINKCRRCGLVNLCMWCPGHSYLETGQLDLPVSYFCDVAHARARMLKGV